MQIFEVVELLEFPYMETREVIQGQTVNDILNETSIERVYLLDGDCFLYYQKEEGEE